MDVVSRLLDSRLDNPEATVIENLPLEHAVTVARWSGAYWRNHINSVVRGIMRNLAKAALVQPVDDLNA